MLISLSASVFGEGGRGNIPAMVADVVRPRVELEFAETIAYVRWRNLRSSRENRLIVIAEFPRPSRGRAGAEHEGGVLLKPHRLVGRKQRSGNFRLRNRRASRRKRSLR